MAEPSPDAITSGNFHLEGITRVCFSPDGTTIFTGGSDSLVRIHKVDDPDAEPGFHGDHTDDITSLACSSEHLMTASKDSTAQMFSHPGDELEGYLSRSAGVPIRWVSVDKKGERVAICGDDLLVKIVDVNDREKVQSLSDNPKGIRSAAWDPSGQYLVTAGCDGKVKIYDMTGTAPLHLKNMDGIIGPSSFDALTSCYACWHPSGKYFAIPLRTNDIGIVNREGWTKQVAFSSDQLRAVVGELAWSPNGRYLASSSDSSIFIWASDTRTVIAKYITKSAITGLVWSPISNLLVFGSMDGSYSRWAEPIPSDQLSPFATEVQEKKRVEKLLDDFGDDIDMEDIGEDADGDEGEDLDVADEWIVDDEGDYGVEQKYGKGRQEVVYVTKAQTAFTPGSTMMKNKKRYLAFSMIGAVDASDQESHNVINVEFHDKSARRGYHFQDHNKYSMASMGEQGISYASTSSSDQASEIHYRPYDSWASQADWTQQLPAGEEATCIATGGPPEDAGLGHIIVSTTKGFVRFFTASGIQRYIWRLGEDVVSMSASKEALFIVHREGGTSLDGCQSLRYTVLDLDTYDIIQDGRLPLPKKVLLSWVGWSAEGAPAMFDSTGVLSLLDRFRRPGQARWVPILDTALLRKEGRVERYWPVGVTSSNMACAILKGTEKEPWFPRPLLQEVGLQIPLINLDSQNGKLEESLMRGNLLVNLLGDIPTYDAETQTEERRVLNERELLQLVQSACKSDNLARALDLARMMMNPSTVEAAAKISSFYHLGGLTDRITNLGDGAKGQKRRADRLERERTKETQRRFPPEHALQSNGGKKGGEVGFAPRVAARRSFGGVKRAETPMSSGFASTGRNTVIPDTPDAEDAPMEYTDYDDLPREGSPAEKRKRYEEPEESFAAPTKKRGEDFSMPAEPKKNPFAKKAAPASNPFAKPAVSASRALDKSTSFFDRVDNIEMSGAPKTKAKATKAAKTNGTAGGGGNQTTLLGMKKSKPPPVPEPEPEPVLESGVIAESPPADLTMDAEAEETQMSTTVHESVIEAEETQEADKVIVPETQMEETLQVEDLPEREASEDVEVQVQETLGSPEPEEGAEDVYL